MSDTAVTITNEPREKPLRWTKEHATEVGLPSPEAINYMVSVANLVLDGAMCTADLYGELKPWEPNRPMPPTHYVTAPDKPPCPCLFCEHHRSVQKVIRANALSKMLFGWEHGFKPMESLRSVYIIKGKFTVHYALMVDELIRKGYIVQFLQADDDGCRVEASLPNQKVPFVGTFDKAAADKAGFSNPLYKSRPEDMYVSKAVGRLYRRAGVGGVVYTPDEAMEIEEPEDRLERVERAAGETTSPPDEKLIPAEVESRFRDAAGTAQTWANEQLALVAKEAAGADGDPALLAQMRLTAIAAALPAAAPPRRGRPPKTVAPTSAPPSPLELAETPAPEKVAQPVPVTELF